MARSDRLTALMEIASEQGGYLTTAQAGAMDIGRARLGDLVKSGDLRRVTQGVYAMRHASLPANVEDPLVAWLMVDRKTLPWQRHRPDAIISHDSAASLYGLGTIIPRLPEITVERGGSTRGGANVEKHVGHVPDEEWRWHSVSEGLRLPVTTPARTIVDLAVSGTQEDYLMRAVDQALERGLLRPGELEEVIGRRHKQRFLREWLARLPRR